MALLYDVDGSDTTVASVLGENSGVLWAVARARMSQDERCFSSETLPSNWSKTGFELLTSSN